MSECCCHGSCSTKSSHDHHHNHHHEDDRLPLIGIILSIVLLVAGLVLDHVFDISQYLLIFIYLLSYFFVATPVLKNAWKALLAKDFTNEFSLMSIATIAAFVIGQYPEAVAVMLLYMIGEYLQHKAVDKANTSIVKLLDLQPKITTKILKDGTRQEVSPESVTIGDILEIKVGERVPLDGKVISSNAALVDTSALTGESVPRSILKGEEILSGMILLDSPILVEVTKEYSDSALSRILHMVNEATEKKSNTELYIRKIARIYTPIVMALAAIIFLLPALVSLVKGIPFEWQVWLYRAAIFLVISCPCALVLSIPLCYFAGIGAASKEGVLFKGGTYIDHLKEVDNVVFDKTGTLTTGQFGVIREQQNSELFIPFVKSLEKTSNHPIAKAVCEYIDENHGDVQDIVFSNVKEVPGKGIQAVYKQSLVHLGSLTWISEFITNDSYKKFLGEATTNVALEMDGALLGILFLKDQPREDSKELAKQLKNIDIHGVHMLSGDNIDIVADIADELNISSYAGNLMPEDKLAYVNELVDAGKKVAFIGDGINDAPVLASSHVGIAMANIGNDVAIESADIVIQNSKPSSVVYSIKLARKVRKIIHQNIIFIFAVKALVMILGTLGYASLWSAVFADVGVALLSVLNALRIMYGKIK